MFITYWIANLGTFDSLDRITTKGGITIVTSLNIRGEGCFHQMNVNNSESKQKSFVGVSESP